MRKRATWLYRTLLSVFSVSALLSGQTTPNSDGFYQQLRNLSPQAGAVAIDKVTLKRDAATIQLNSGVLCFTPAVNNRYTGAVFVGDGKLLLEPPVGIERASLSVFSKEKE